MARLRLMLLGMVWLASLGAQTRVDLPEMVVLSPRIANQSPVTTFAMPVSALSYEPRVDVQARNLAEGQADISIRGGSFENTAFRIGGVTVLDPQTGHYLAELPVAPLMLGPLAVVTGAENAFGATNANVGSIAYDWRPIRSQGILSAAIGQFNLHRAELYQGVVSAPLAAGTKLGADADYAWSESDGSIAYGEHRFQRIGGRVQRIAGAAQTDFYAGYQAKFFGWPNLYTPFGFNETESLQTVFMTLNHRQTWADGQYFEAGIYYRRNKDDYEFNRTVPGASNPFIHTTWMTGAAIEGRRAVGNIFIRVRGEVAADKLESTSLNFGHYHSRTILKTVALAEKQWAMAAGGTLELAAGLSLDDTNRDGAAYSPIIEITRRFQTAEGMQSVRFSYAKSTQVPSYTALNSDAAAGLFRGNANLQRAVTHNIELQFTGRLADWQGEATFFVRQDDRLVDWTFRRGVTARTANPVDIGTGGVEMVARREAAWGNLTLGYTYLAKDADYGSTSIDASFYALNYAKHRLTAALTWHLTREWDLRWDNEARLQADNPLRTTGGDEAVLSALALAWRPQAWRGVELSLQVDNLWNTNFQEVPAVPAANRQI
ncbi:MAG: TonB-dependent receptor, partial [Opitutaceae bacterium]|nr:TonB-dependent receptor [Opitutaceae bacterium]